MNTNQSLSLVRWLLNAVSGGVIAYTAAKSPAAKTAGAYIANLITGPDVVSAGVLGVTWLWGHITHMAIWTPKGISSSPALPASKVSAFLLVGALSGVLVFNSGCASGPVAAAYKAESATDISVTAAMQAWGDFVKMYHPPVSEELKVQAAFRTYQKAELLALDSTATYMAMTSTNAAASPQTMEEAQQGVYDSISDIVNLVTSFGVKIP